jgi:hypothetical protein
VTRHGRNQPQVGAAALRPTAEFVLKVIQRDPHTVSGRHLNLRGRYAALRVRHEYRLVTARSPHRGVLRTGQKLNSP